MKKRNIFFVSFLMGVLTGAGFAADAANNKTTPAQQYIDFALKACDHAEQQIPEMTRVAEIVADRFIAGGAFGLFREDVNGSGQGLTEELMGRCGNMIHTGFCYHWKQEGRTDAERANDILVVGWTREPNLTDMERLQEYKKNHCYIIGFGPRNLPSLAEEVKVCDAWFDTGYGTDDFALTLPDGTKVGHGNLLNDCFSAWAFTGEFIAALTRRGKMPPIADSILVMDKDMRRWNKYFHKIQFEDEYKVPPVPAGKLAHAYLDAMRGLIKKYANTQLPAVYRTADLIVEELERGQKTTVADISHMPWAYVGKNESDAWAIASNETLYAHLPDTWENYKKTTPDGALVLRLGYSGFPKKEYDVLKQKNQRVMLIASEDPRPERQRPNDLLTYIDMGWNGDDACVDIPGYPIRILCPAGPMQLVAYETVNVEVLARLHALTKPDSQKSASIK